VHVSATGENKSLGDLPKEELSQHTAEIEALKLEHQREKIELQNKLQALEAQLNEEHDDSIKAQEKLHRTQQTSRRSSPRAQTGWIIETGFGVIRSFDGAGLPEHVGNKGAQHIEDIGPQHVENVNASSPRSTPGPHDGQFESRHSSERDGESRRLKIRRSIAGALRFV